MVLIALALVFIFLDIRDNVTKNPEISNMDYEWFQRFSVSCHPTAKAEAKEALENDGKVLRDEYLALLDKCSTYNELEAAGAKDKLKEFLK